MSILRYLQQLVEDIRESAKNRDENIKFPPELVSDSGIPNHLKHLPIVPAQKIYKWMRLDPEAFPPVNQMEYEQIIYMCNILRQLFEHYRFEVQLPHSLPIEMVYEYLIKAFYKVDSISDEDSLNVITFCQGDESTCPFGEYCAKVNEDYCETWLYGYWWEGYEGMKKNL
jgi:hypothetical protein